MEDDPVWENGDDASTNSKVSFDNESHELFSKHYTRELWFQQDGAICHTARATIDLLKDTFGDRLISRFGTVNWPPRSCDLTPLDYFLRGYVKSLFYADKTQTLDHLEDNIRRVIAYIRPQMSEKVIENWMSRLDYIRASLGTEVIANRFNTQNTNVSLVKTGLTDFRPASFYLYSLILETPACVIHLLISEFLYQFPEESRGFQTRQKWSPTCPPKVTPTSLYRQDFAKLPLNHYYNVLDESRSFFRVHTGYFSNIPKCIKAEFIASWACSQSSVVSSSKR
ncbi:uncharacterized protein TNCV_4423071 [Trichonephila clavipes]|nr:uncharacterized protein TNCV_4423071 [Trichonephila clavipes]